MNVGHGTSLRVKLPAGYPTLEAPSVPWLGRWGDRIIVSTLYCIYSHTHTCHTIHIVDICVSMPCFFFDMGFRPGASGVPTWHSSQCPTRLGRL